MSQNKKYYLELIDEKLAELTGVNGFFKRKATCRYVHKAGEIEIILSVDVRMSHGDPYIEAYVEICIDELYKELVEIFEKVYNKDKSQVIKSAIVIGMQKITNPITYIDYDYLEFIKYINDQYAYIENHALNNFSDYASLNRYLDENRSVGGVRRTHIYAHLISKLYGRDKSCEYLWSLKDEKISIFEREVMEFLLNKHCN